MADDDKRVADLETAMRQMTDNYWRFQGRINALEIIAVGLVLDRAAREPNPFQWVQDYLQNIASHDQYAFCRR